MNEGRGVNRLDTIKARAAVVAGKPDNREPTEKEWIALTDGAIHDVPRLVAVVEAVLGQHEPDVFGDCDTCGSSYCGDFVPVEYPCPTVTAIERALKEEQ